MCHSPKVFLLKLIIESSLRVLSLYFNLTKLTFIFFSFRMSEDDGKFLIVTMTSSREILS